MKKIINKIKSIIKKIDDIPILFLLSIALAIFISMALFILAMYCISLALGEEMSNSFSDTIRNFAWVFSMWATLTGGIVGLRLAWRGRKIQQEQREIQEKQWETQHTSGLQERYQKASDMLSSEVEATRIAACTSLYHLGVASKALKSPCVRLLFSFINNPYLEKHEEEVYIRLTRIKKAEYLTDLFPANEPLRADIQDAITSFSAIYEYYGTAGIDGTEVRLPLYFWQNKEKGDLFLIKANLYEADLRKASVFFSNFWKAILYKANLQGAAFSVVDLREANLEQANLQEAFLQYSDFQDANLKMANLYKADLYEAKLQDADISGANMQEAYFLIEEQILSAKWGYDERGKGGPPKLSDYLKQDKKIINWLEKPHYDKRKKSKDSE